MTTEYVVNPHTSRVVKRSGRVYKRLVQEGLIEAVESETVLADSDSEETIRRVNKQLPSSKQAVRGRGRFEGQTVVRNMPRNWDAMDVENDVIYI